MRARRACIVVAVLFAFLAASQFAGAWAKPGVVQQVAQGLVGFEGLSMAQEQLPEGFEEEAFAAEGDVQVSQAAHTFGFTVPEVADAVYERLNQALLQKGWSQSGQGSAVGATFQKSEGEFRWLFLQCVQVGSSTTVVAAYA